MLSFIKKFTSIIVVAGTFFNCGEAIGSLKNIGVKGDINRTSAGEIILTTTVTNYSDDATQLHSIAIDSSLHEALNLTRIDLSRGDCFLGGCTYEINRRIPSGQSISIQFKGNYIPDFISGEIDFYIGKGFFNFKTISVDCCK